MKKDCFNNVKCSKPFRKLDVFLYAFLAIIVALLFLFSLLYDKPQNGFKATYLGNEIFSFDYDKKEYKTFDFAGEIVIESLENGLLVTFYYDSNKTNYNVIYIDYIEKSVIMKDANCSNQKDCTYTPALKNSGAIICAPHGLKIIPSDGFMPLITG